MSDISESKKIKNLEKLKELARKARDGKASPSDASEAEALNEMLGGEYSSLVSQISLATGSSRSAEESREDKLDPIQKGNKILEEDRDYFNSESVKKSKATLSSIAEGNSSNESDLIHAVSNLSNSHDREYRNRKFSEIKEIIIDIYSKAYDEARELSKEENTLVEGLLSNHKEHLSRHHQDEAFTKIVGTHKNQTSLSKAVKSNKSKLEEASRNIQNEGLKEASVLMDKGHNSIMEILKANQSASLESRAAAKPRVIQMAAENFDSLTKADLSPHIPKRSQQTKLSISERLTIFAGNTPKTKVDLSRPISPSSTPSADRTKQKSQNKVGGSMQV